MPDAATTAGRLANDIAGIDTFTDLTPATARDKVLSLLNLVTPQSGMTLRGALDEMSPACHRQLVAELTALHANLVTANL